ncbi:MAG TPA: hypothetical protein VHO07_15295 [Streptosporangiaceae bacterium]|nr:hypothetical protein [Streptosporangiaceae bacterium]
MSATADVMAVLLAFFGVGVAVGIVVVVALSAHRGDKADRWSRRGRTPDGGSGYYGDDEPDEPPWWQTRGD